MKKQLTAQQRAYRDARDKKVINMIAPCGLLGLGIWMLLDPAKPKHSAIEKATTAMIKDMWGIEAAIVLLLLGGLWMFFAIRGFLKFKKTHPKPL